jgi:hypothetical protein
MQDDRTPEQTRSHYILIGGTDKLMSGWGECRDRPSYAFWAFDPSKVSFAYVDRWVRRREGMIRVRQVSSDYRPRNPAHVHIYVVDPGHPASL